MRKNDPIYFVRPNQLNEDSPSFYRNVREIKYVGITEVSIHVELLDGTLYRIKNPDFTKGLDIEVSVPEKRHD